MLGAWDFFANCKLELANSFTDMVYNTLVHPILITKADGEREPFAPDKLEQSLERPGPSAPIRPKILDRIMRQLRDGMLTEEFYRHAFELLRQEELTPVAARYSMKRAIFALGPSGFP